MVLNDKQSLYVRSMGKMLRVTAVFQDVAEANRHMAKGNNDAVVAEFGSLILLADAYDQGIRVND